MNNDYNVLSDKAYQQRMFDFDLQLFGGGGGGGKSAGKIIGSIAFGFISAGTSMFGTGLSYLTNFTMGAALFSSVWSATHRQDMSYGSSASNIQRFERAQETMSADGQIPVVYGRRQITGNQTYHKTDSDASTLWKHVVLCEGGIEGIESVSANDLIIPTGNQTSNTVFTLQNLKYKDATVVLSGRTLTLYCNGKSRSIYLCVTSDMSSGNTYWEYQVNISSLISYINRLGEGWQAFPVAATNKYPGELWNVSKQSAYRHIVNFDLDTVSGGTTYTLRDCVAPNNYEEVGGYPNMAWLDMKFTLSSELNGNPGVTCLVKGRKVYDLRTGRTAYSTNPALCIRDFMLSKRYGLGKWFTEDMLDSDSWKEAADYCDEQITFLDGSGAKVIAKRYELNMVIDNKRSALEWLQEMLANFCGYIVYSNGKLKLRIEKETPISYKFNDDNCFDLKISPLALSETPNRYEVTIIDPLNNWSTVKCLCDDYADQKQRQKIITKSVSLEGVTSQNQALRLARFYRDYNLVCPMQLSFTTGLQAMHLEPGDVVTISYHGVFKEMPIRISEIKETNKGTFEISGRQYNNTIYGDLLGGGVHWFDYSTLDNPYTDTILDVKGLNYTKQSYIAKDGTHINIVNLTWTKTKYQFFKRYVIDYRESNSGSWSTYCSTVENSCSINVNLYWTYDFRVRVENTIGRLSDGAAVYKVFIDGKNAPPANVTGLTYELAFRSVILTWEPNPDPDIRGYRIYQGDYDVGLSGCEMIADNLDATTMYIPLTEAHDYRFYVFAIDTVGKISEQPASCLVKVNPLPDVDNFFAVKNGDTIQFFWDEIKDANYEIRWGHSWESGKVVAKVNSNVYTLFFPLIGTQTFSIKAYNGWGLYSMHEVYLQITLTPATTRNIIAEFDKKKDGWPGVKNFLTVDTDGLLMEDLTRVGEYYANIHLNKKVDARNWIEYTANCIGKDVIWDKIDDKWEDYNIAWLPIADNEVVNVENFITTKTEGVNYHLYSFPLNGNTVGASQAKKVTYANSRFDKGAVIKPNTVIKYNVDVPPVFNMAFNVRALDRTDEHVVFLTLYGDNYWLRVEYNNGFFVLSDRNCNNIAVPNYYRTNDIITFYIKQEANKRVFTVTNPVKDKEVTGELNVLPLGKFKELNLGYD